MWTLVLDVLLAGLAAGMFFGWHYGITRQTAAAPLVVAVLDAIFVGKIDPSLTPVLSALLIALQAVVLLGGAAVLREDRRRARAKAENRRRKAAVRQAMARRAEEQTGHPSLSAAVRKVPAARRDTRICA